MMSHSKVQRLKQVMAKFLLDEEIPCRDCAEVMNEIEEIVTKYLEIRSKQESQRQEDLVNAYRVFHERKILDGMVRATERAERRDPEGYRI